MKLFNVKRTFR